MLFGIAATYFSVRKTFKETPAQCMRPIPPKKVHKTWIEKRENIWRRISYKNKLVFRNIFLNKTRVILSSIGVIGCVLGVIFGAVIYKEILIATVKEDIWFFNSCLPTSAKVSLNYSKIYYTGFDSLSTKNKYINQNIIIR